MKKTFNQKLLIIVMLLGFVVGNITATESNVSAETLHETKRTNKTWTKTKFVYGKRRQINKKTYYQNKRKKIRTSEVIKYRANGKRQSYSEITYYRNGKRKTLQRISYNSKGQRTRMDQYTYNKAGKLRSTKKLGNARHTRTDYKYGKRSRVRRYSYNSKGRKRRTYNRTYKVKTPAKPKPTPIKPKPTPTPSVPKEPKYGHVISDISEWFNTKYRYMFVSLYAKGDYVNGKLQWVMDDAYFGDTNTNGISEAEKIRLTRDVILKDSGVAKLLGNPVLGSKKDIFVYVYVGAGLEQW